MVAYIINILISILIGLIFIILGIRQYRSESPVVMNTGQKPLRPEQLSDMKAWNTGHGKATIAFGIAVAFTVGIFPVVLNYVDARISVISLIIVIVAEIVGLMINHDRLERKYRIR